MISDMEQDGMDEAESSASSFQRMESNFILQVSSPLQYMVKVLHLAGF